MKKIILSVLFLQLLTGCYQLSYQSHLSMVAEVVDVDGNPQSFDLNDGAEVCVRLMLDRKVYNYSNGGVTEKFVDYCVAFTSSEKGISKPEFSGNQIIYTPTSLGLKKDGEKVNITDIKIYLKLEDGRTIHGERKNVKPVSQDHFEVVAKFVVNKSNYSPDQKIDVNQSKRRYIK